MELPMQRCDNCRFWDHDSAMDGESACRRYPPTVVDGLFRKEDSCGDGSLYAGLWPETTYAEWCGEWQPLPIKPKPNKSKK